MSEETPIIFSKYHSKFVVGVLDIVHSTETTMSLSVEKIDEFYTIFLQSVADIISKYDGKVVKNIGDGVLFYFPATIDLDPTAFLQVTACGRALLLERTLINQKLSEVELPIISYRISMSYGPISAVLDPENNIIDLFGATVNTCSKINKLAKPDTLIVGQALHDELAKASIPMEKIGEYKIANGGFDVYEISKD